MAFLDIEQAFGRGWHIGLLKGRRSETKNPEAHRPTGQPLQPPCNKHQKTSPTRPAFKSA